MMGKINIQKLGISDPFRADAQREIRTDMGGNTAAPVERTPPPAGDVLEISGRAAEVGRLVDGVKAMPDTRVDLVTGLRGQIEAGAYQPPAETIADAIIKDERS